MVYCSKCGNKVDDEAAFCSRCGEKLSLIKDDKKPEIEDNATNTEKKPFRRVFYSRLKVNREFESKTFQITSNAAVEFTPDMCKYVAIRSAFELEADKQKGPFWDFLTTEARGFELLYDVGFSRFRELISNTIEKIGLDILMKNGIDWYSSKMLEADFYNFIKGGEGHKHIQIFYNYKVQLEEMIDEINQQREEERSNRSYWTGGGFGIRGAISGKIKADMMNLGTNALRSIGDFLVDSSDMEKVQQYMDDHRIFATQSLSAAQYNMMCDMATFIYSILVNEGACDSVEFLNNCTLSSEIAMSNKTGARIENTYKSFCNKSISKEQAIKKLCVCISEHPYRMDAYIYIYNIDRSTKDALLKLGEYCGIESGVQIWVNNIDLNFPESPM